MVKSVYQKVYLKTSREAWPRVYWEVSQEVYEEVEEIVRWRDGEVEIRWILKGQLGG